MQIFNQLVHHFEHRVHIYILISTQIFKINLCYFAIFIAHFTCNKYHKLKNINVRAQSDFVSLQSPFFVRRTNFIHFTIPAS